jgi:hypothetical protein
MRRVDAICFSDRLCPFRFNGNFHSFVRANIQNNCIYKNSHVFQIVLLYVVLEYFVVVQYKVQYRVRLYLVSYKVDSTRCVVLENFRCSTVQSTIQGYGCTWYKVEGTRGGYSG